MPRARRLVPLIPLLAALFLTAPNNAFGQGLQIAQLLLAEALAESRLSLQIVLPRKPEAARGPSAHGLATPSALGAAPALRPRPMTQQAFANGLGLGSALRTLDDLRGEAWRRRVLMKRLEPLAAVPVSLSQRRALRASLGRAADPTRSD